MPRTREQEAAYSRQRRAAGLKRHRPSGKEPRRIVTDEQRARKAELRRARRAELAAQGVRANKPLGPVAVYDPEDYAHPLADVVVGY